MLKTIDEVKELEIEAGVVVNGIDNPNIMSVDSTEPVQTEPDELELSEEEKTELPEVKTQKPVKEETEVKEEKVETKSNPKPKSKPTAKERIGTITKKWRTAERERDYERDKRLEAEAKLKELTASEELADNKPQKEDFDDEDDYLEAIMDWKLEGQKAASQEAEIESIEDENEKQAVVETYEGLDDAIDKGKEKYDDFDDVVLDEDLVISPELTQIILETENPEDVMYYLASNPEESARLSDLSITKIGIEVGKLEVKLVEEGENGDNPNPPKKQSKAPEPITPVRTTGVTDKDPNKMSPKEYRAWREKQT